MRPGGVSVYMLRNPRTHFAAHNHPPHTDVRPHTQQAAPCWILCFAPDLKILRIRPFEKSRTGACRRLGSTNSIGRQIELRSRSCRVSKIVRASWHMQQLDIPASAAAKNDSGGVTNLNTTTAAPIDLKNTAGSIKERSREKVRPFISDFWATRCSEDTIDHRKEANNKRMANYWMVKELKESGINTLRWLNPSRGMSARGACECAWARVVPIGGYIPGFGTPPGHMKRSPIG